jgi:broad specificity phosphatase PhoE
MHDPLLTQKGESQCRALSARFPYHSTVEALVSSPLRRALYTALLSFEPEIARGLRIIALPEVQETADLPCDTGSDPAVLEVEFLNKPVDLKLVQDGWNSKAGKWSTNIPALEARAREARRWLKSRPEKEIVLVTHGGILHYLSEDWLGSSSDLGKFESIGKYRRLIADIGTGWANVEFRSYEFVDEGDNASMTEMGTSRKRRSGGDRSLLRNEQLQLREAAYQEWEKNGLIVEHHI